MPQPQTLEIIIPPEVVEAADAKGMKVVGCRGYVPGDDYWYNGRIHHASNTSNATCPWFILAPIAPAYSGDDLLDAIEALMRKSGWSQFYAANDGDLMGVDGSDDNTCLRAAIIARLKEEGMLPEPLQESNEAWLERKKASCFWSEQTRLWDAHSPGEGILGTGPTRSEAIKAAREADNG